MTKITYISPTNQGYVVKAEIGQTLMQIAVNNNIEGIDADCGGQCACATCHIIIPKEYRDHTGQADEDESALLDFLDNRKAGSRLSCQVVMSTELGGMIIKIPDID
jgi:2Fe-2S ferredoxin